MEPAWLDWIKRLRAIAQNGLTYASDPFDIERYNAVREIAAEIGSQFSDTELSVLRDIFSAETGYATPKLDVRGAVFQGGAALVCTGTGGRQLDITRRLG